MHPIFVDGSDLPMSWETAVIECWKNGDFIETQYDKPGDPPSRDCTMMIRVLNPMMEPRIHRAFPGSLEDLWKYRQEVVHGVHDHLANGKEGHWPYTYHDRFTRYPSHKSDPNTVLVENFDVDQIGILIEQLIIAPHTRRAQAITWIPCLDQPDEHCPCVQRLWFRILNDELHMNLHIRSNDAFKAAFMNMYAMIELQSHIAKILSARLGKEIRVGDYVHIADSFHIYGSYFKEFEDFLKTVETRHWTDRSWRSDSSLVQEAFTRAQLELDKEKG